jgi:hypothetical protein
VPQRWTLLVGEAKGSAQRIAHLEGVLMDVRQSQDMTEANS